MKPLHKLLMALAPFAALFGCDASSAPKQKTVAPITADQEKSMEEAYKESQQGQQP